MKKVTMTFIVDDEVVDDVQNELTWGEKWATWLVSSMRSVKKATMI